VFRDRGVLPAGLRAHATAAGLGPPWLRRSHWRDQDRPGKPVLQSAQVGGHSTLISQALAHGSEVPYSSLLHANFICDFSVKAGVDIGLYPHSSNWTRNLIFHHFSYIHTENRARLFSANTIVVGYHRHREVQRKIDIPRYRSE
jgi:hypothetical protein